jgi:hypothetical protein
MESPTLTRIARGIGLAAALGAAGLAAPALAQGQAGAPAPHAFTTADLARACGPAADDANTLASRSACYATLVTVGQMHAMYTTGRPTAPRAFCVPEPSPTLARVSADFVAWAAANPTYANARAAEGVLRFAAATYPCAQQPAARRR